MTYNNDFKKKIESVNLHITKACNYRCKFCFAHFNQVTQKLSLNEWKEIIKKLYDSGMLKVTFVGGEPTLVHYLPELIEFAKDLGLMTMLVTNGSMIDIPYLEKIGPSLDWLGLSIDTGVEEVSKQLGRGPGNHVTKTRELCKLAKEYDIHIKVNTVVTSRSWQEDMSWLIEEIKPERWKVFQVLPINGENDEAEDLLITEEKFNYFLSAHAHLNPVGESNDAMTDSYVMVDPAGCFFNNSTGRLSHGLSLLEHDVRDAFRSTNFSPEKFEERDGSYFHDYLSQSSNDDKSIIVLPLSDLS